MGTRLTGCRGVVALALLVCGPPACRDASDPRPRYLVTDKPLDVGLGAAVALCVAVDPKDPQGLWWWHPGASGCLSRSSGPGVFPAEEATVSPAAQSDRLNLGFRLQTHSRTHPFIDVRLVVEDGTMRASGSGAQATLHRRRALDLPESPGKPRP